ncbi:MAG: GTP-binding protein [Rhodothermaceae bacterium]|nr:GTP-binding protein [Rhodothermaceae bacterium]
MIQKKICILGSYAVGKTSLVRQFVHSIFSETYLSTLGVTIEKKTVAIDGEEVALVIWDVAGEEDDFQIPMTYVRGAAGYLLLVDGTRPATLEAALDIRERVQQALGPIPHVILLNKADLPDAWALGEGTPEPLQDQPWPVFQTSAKTGAHVEEAFHALAEAALRGR